MNKGRFGGSFIIVLGMLVMCFFCIVIGSDSILNKRNWGYLLICKAFVYFLSACYDCKMVSSPTTDDSRFQQSFHLFVVEQVIRRMTRVEADGMVGFFVSCYTQLPVVLHFIVPYNVQSEFWIFDKNIFLYQFGMHLNSIGLPFKLKIINMKFNMQ